MKSLRLIVVVPMVLALLILGCAHKVVDYRVKVDPELDAIIEAYHVVTAHQGDLLRFDLQGENRSFFEVNIGYSIDWYDSAGLQIKTLLSRPQYLKVRSNGDFSLNGIAPSPSAVDFRIHLFKG